MHSTYEKVADIVESGATATEKFEQLCDIMFPPVALYKTPAILKYFKLGLVEQQEFPPHQHYTIPSRTKVDQDDRARRITKDGTDATVNNILTSWAMMDAANNEVWDLQSTNKCHVPMLNHEADPFLTIIDRDPDGTTPFCITRVKEQPDFTLESNRDDSTIPDIVVAGVSEDGQPAEAKLIKCMAIVNANRKKVDETNKSQATWGVLQFFGLWQFFKLEKDIVTKYRALQYHLYYDEVYSMLRYIIREAYYNSPTLSEHLKPRTEDNTDQERPRILKIPHAALEEADWEW